MRYLVLIACIGLTFSARSQAPNSPVKKTRHFEFHSNYWLNLHHFLYQMAKGDQLAHLMEDGNELINIGHDSIMHTLTEEEGQILTVATQYYRDNIINKSLLFDLADLRLSFQQQDSEGLITDTSFTKTHLKILNNFSGIYRKKFWPVHHARNLKIMDMHCDIIRELEEEVIERLESLAGYEWSETMIRVDLTAYANWAGAYTQARPTFNIMISTLDPFSAEPDFIETVFHEGAHLLFTRESDFRSRIYFMSKKMEVDFPGGLWHASLFYLCGKLMQEKLAEKNIQHQMVMETKNIFSESNTHHFRAVLDKYYNGEAELEETIKGLLIDP